MHRRMGHGVAAPPLLVLSGVGARRQPARKRPVLVLFLLLLLVSQGSSAIITGACEMDTQCGGGMCCAISLWIRTLRMCAPMGREGDNCHPKSHKVPYPGKRLHHTCPCLPNMACITTEEGRSKCLPSYKYQDYYL